MNRIYRLVYSNVLNAWVAVSEISRGHGAKKASRAAVALALAPLCLNAHAAPTGGVVTSGVGRIVQSQSNNGSVNTTITQGSQNLNLNWSGFNVGANETVNFIQPNALSVAVNRIYDTNGAQIDGRLNANGQVFLIDPNGIIFGKGAQVNVGGLVASTMDLTGGSANTATFGGNSLASVKNDGSITANNGYVALLGHQVVNSGTVTAQLGTVALAGGSAFTLTFDGNQLVNLVVTQSQLNDLTRNGGLIRSNGGQVILTSGAKDALLASAVNNTGVIEAQTVASRGGVIELTSGMVDGSVNVGGTLDASAKNGNGGFINTSAAHVAVADHATVTTQSLDGKTGTWLIDPHDFTIAASGGDITGTALSADLATNNVSLQSSSGAAAGSGNLNVNDTVSWSANKLTLTAANNININSVMNATGSASLALNTATANGTDAAVAGGQVLVGMNKTGFTGQVNLAPTTSISINGTPYTIINSLGAPGSMTGTDLQGIAGNLAGHYVLGSNIDATPTSTWNSGAGFTSIGHWTTPEFTGTINGLGHTIDGLSITQTSGGNYGFISDNTGGTIVNTGIVGGTITGNNQVGSLVGTMSGGLIQNDYSTATVNGTNATGGLVGYITGGTFTGDFTSGTVTGNHEYTGGVLGNIVGTSVSTTDSWSSATVNGNQMAGGFVGSTNSNISDSYATGAVTVSYRDGGGFAGTNNSGTISNSYATGNVYTGAGGGTCGSGGFVGWNSSTIANSYSTGAVTGAAGVWTGGFAGVNGPAGIITTSYSTGQVIANGATSVGGFLGYNDNTSGGVTGSFWNTTTSGYTTSYGDSGLVGMTTAQMQNQVNYTSATTANGNVNPGWDFANTWVMYNGNTYPLLRSFMTDLTISGKATETYNGTPYSGGSVAYSTTPDMANIFGAPVSSWSGTSQGAVNVGTYTLNPTGSAYSNQQGYIISYAPGTLTINPAPLTVLTVGGTTVANKVYDGNNIASLSNGVLSGVVGGGVTLNQSGYFSSVNVGNNISVIATDTIGGTSASNYRLVEPTGLSANITPASLTITADNAGKVYGQTFTGGPFSTSGLVNGETIGSVTEASAGSGATASVGSYGLSASSPVAGSGSAFNANNYAITYVNGNLAVTPASLTVTADNASKLYGSANPTFGLSYSGFVNGDTASSALTNQGSTMTSAMPGSNVGSYAVNPFGVVADNNYIVHYAPGTLTINPASLTVTADNASKLYGSANPTFGLSYSGFVNGDTASSALTNQGSTMTSAMPGSNVGSYAINPFGVVTDGNYSIRYTPGTLTVNPEVLTVSGLSGTNRVYNGNTMDALSGVGTAQLIGLFGGQTLALGGTNSGTLSSANVGKETVNTSLTLGNGTGLASNYVLEQPTGLTANITPATLTYTATSKSVVSGGSLGVLSGTVQGFVGGDNLGNATKGSLAWTTTATTTSHPGQYAIDGSGLNSTNYTFIQAPGNATAMTIKALPAIPDSYMDAFLFDYIIRSAEMLGIPSLSIFNGGVNLLSLIGEAPNQEGPKTQFRVYQRNSSLDHSFSL
ncbi:MBG domain-containing protein [Ferrovum myxofaciens]|nr:MBG domain-containing protein [Ferrovum myxofaciens]